MRQTGTRERWGVQGGGGDRQAGHAERAVVGVFKGDVRRGADGKARSGVCGYAEGRGDIRAEGQAPPRLGAGLTWGQPAGAGLHLRVQTRD